MSNQDPYNPTDYTPHPYSQYQINQSSAPGTYNPVTGKFEHTGTTAPGTPPAPTPSPNNAPGWTGAAGQGYYDPTTGNLDPFYSAPTGSMPLQRPGIDARVQGNLENPYAGYLFGKPGAAETDEARLAALAEQARNGQAAQIDNTNFNADRGLEMGSRGAQGTALSKYLDLANGKGPSLAQAQANYGIARSNAQQASIAAGARGGGANLVAAQQAASNAAGTASADIMGQATMAREKEQMDALNAYGSMATQMRANDLQRQGLSAEQAARQAQLEEAQHGINATTGLGYEGMRQSEASTQQQGMEWNESENQNAYMGGLGIGVQQHAADAQQQGAMIGGIGAVAGGLIGTVASPGAGTVAGAQAGGAAGSAIGQATAKSQSGDVRSIFGQPGQVSYGQATAPTTSSPTSSSLSSYLRTPTSSSTQQTSPTMSPYLRQPTSTQPAQQSPALSSYLRAPSISSDVRNKRDIGDGRPAVQQQMGAMAPNAYEYRDPNAPGAGPGPRVGVMAQDMERGPYGHQLVRDTPTGKKIDGPGALSLALAAGADHEQRLRQLEQPTAPYRDMSKLTPAEWAEYTMAQNARQNGIASPADEAYVQRARGAVPYVPARAAAPPPPPEPQAPMAPPPQPDRLRYAKDYVTAGVPGMLMDRYLRGGR